MIAVDTNMLVYAHRADSPWHKTATADRDFSRFAALTTRNPLVV